MDPAGGLNRKGNPEVLDCLECPGPFGRLCPWGLHGPPDQMVDTHQMKDKPWATHGVLVPAGFRLNWAQKLKRRERDAVPFTLQFFSVFFLFEKENKRKTPCSKYSVLS